MKICPPISVAIVTAMATEVWPLVRRRNQWRRVEREHAGHRVRCYEGDRAVVYPGGIGHAAGTRAANAMVELYRPRLLVAAGLAGGLKPQWTLGRSLIATEVIGDADGRRFACTSDAAASLTAAHGVVVSSRIIAGAAEKRRLAGVHPEAAVVDMEGAAVAAVAQAHNIPFLAVKAVSDDLEFDLPPLNQFVDAAGHFQGLAFVAWAATRPQWWPVIVRLKLISNQGAAALAQMLRKVIAAAHDPATRDMISGSSADAP